MTPPSSTPTSSFPSSESLPPSGRTQSPRRLGSLLLELAHLLVAAWIGTQIAGTLPRLIDHMVATGKWQPFAFAMGALALLLWPVKTLEAIKSLGGQALSRVTGNGGK